MNYENLSLIVGDAYKLARGNHKVSTPHVMLTYAKYHEAIEQEYAMQHNGEPVSCLLKDNEHRYVYTMQLIGQEAWRQTQEQYDEEQ